MPEQVLDANTFHTVAVGRGSILRAEQSAGAEDAILERQLILID